MQPYERIDEQPVPAFEHDRSSDPDNRQRRRGKRGGTVDLGARARRHSVGTAYAGRRRRVRNLKTMLVTMPSSQPRTAAARMIQTSDAWPVPTTQLSFTCRVFATTSEIKRTSSATRPNAQV